jgi:hypothetical protein
MSEILNGNILFLVCGVIIIYVTIQALLFIRLAWRRGGELGLEERTMRQAMTNSAVFSIIPSLPIVIMLMVLTQTFGRYFPWLRLSVIGSAAYENMAADITAKSYGLTGLKDPAFSPEIYVAAFWVMSVGIIWGIVFNIFFLGTLDKKAKNLQEKGGGFIQYASTALFMGMLAVMSAPYITNTRNKTGILSFCAAAAAALIMEKIARKRDIRVLREFSFPISLLIGMSAAVLTTPLFR